MPMPVVLSVRLLLEKTMLHVFWCFEGKGVGEAVEKRVIERTRDREREREREGEGEGEGEMGRRENKQIGGVSVL